LEFIGSYELFYHAAAIYTRTVPADNPAGTGTVLRAPAIPLGDLFHVVQTAKTGCQSLENPIIALIFQTLYNIYSKTISKFAAMAAAGASHGSMFLWVNSRFLKRWICFKNAGSECNNEIMEQPGVMARYYAEMKAA